MSKLFETRYNMPVIIINEMDYWKYILGSG